LRTIEDEVAAVGRLDVVPRILDVVCLSTGMRFAAVARVTADRWIACAVRDEIAFGLAPGGELQVSTTLCNEVRSGDEAIIIDHVADDAVYRGHATPAMYGFQSYISIPIYYRGAFFGTLCAIDPEPARLDTPQTRAMFELFADLIARHMDAAEQLEQSRAALLDARAAAELREQFIAVLGHDLRNPLAAVDAAARLLKKRPLDPHSKTLLDHLQASVDRMAGLIDNVLDFARGRLGGGFIVDRSVSPALESALLQVVDELATARPDREIVADVRLAEPVNGDARRLAQLLSNLVGNAVTHGAPNGPIRVYARSSGGTFDLSVSNAGEPIPPATLARLFEPFSRASAKPHQQGLGLGLYIAREIARAHSGVLEVASDAAETRFTFRMPLA